jgi:nucleoid-associated protein YgaU
MVDKIKIKPLSPSQLAEIEVQFNPNEYSIVKPVAWNTEETSATGGQGKTTRKSDAPRLVFGGGDRRTLTLRLFYDVTEGGDDADVRTETNKIVALTRIERDLQQPPVCMVSWGESPPAGSDFPFRGVVTNLTQNFVLFHSSGRPLRANLVVVFTECIDVVQNQKEIDPDFTTYLVKLGDDLSAISAKVYRDPAKWRVIADANRIDDPRNLTVGARLAIPKVG